VRILQAMMEAAQLWTYVAIAVAAVVVTFLLLLVTKVPTVVTIGAAVVVGAVTVLLARFDLGHWDPLAPLAFIATAAYAFAVSFALLALGRWQRWSLFISKPPSSTPQ
jgi:hypothetical protein